MLQLSSVYINRNILSLRTGGPIGFAYYPVINPNNLKIEGWYATEKGDKKQIILPVIEVRDIISKGIVVNDHDSLTHPDDLVRLQKIITTEFELLGKYVETENKKRIGKIADYAVDESSMFIKKLYVNQSLLRGFSTKQIIIDRDQIIEITDKKIIISDTSLKVKSRDSIAAPAI